LYLVYKPRHGTKTERIEKKGRNEKNDQPYEHLTCPGLPEILVYFIENPRNQDYINYID